MDVLEIPDTVKELRALAKTRNIRGWSNKNKAALIEAIKSNYLKTTEPSPVDAPVDAPVVDATPAASESEAQVKDKKKRGPNKWNRFLAEYTKEHGVLIKDAMKNRPAYDEWLAKQQA
jgi:hypothetical protein